MLQIPPKFCELYGKWEVSTPKCCQDSWNGSFQLQNAATSKENVQKKRIQEKIPKRKKISPKTIPDPFLSGWKKHILYVYIYKHLFIFPYKLTVYSTHKTGNFGDGLWLFYQHYWLFWAHNLTIFNFQSKIPHMIYVDDDSNTSYEMMPRWNTLDPEVCIFVEGHSPTS
jgi:hypothetical protein